MLIGIIGFFAGIIGGMGMGGGTILIPALILFASIDPKSPKVQTYYPQFQ